MLLPKPGKHRYIVKIKKINSGFHARKNPKEQYLKVVMFSDASFNKKHIYVYDRSLDNIAIHTLNRGA